MLSLLQVSVVFRRRNMSGLRSALRGASSWYKKTGVPSVERRGYTAKGDGVQARRKMVDFFPSFSRGALLALIMPGPLVAAGCSSGGITLKLLYPAGFRELNSMVCCGTGLPTCETDPDILAASFQAMSSKFAAPVLMASSRFSLSWPIMSLFSAMTVVGLERTIAGRAEGVVFSSTS